MYILGISGFYHDSAACILKDEELMAAVQEERFTRIKNDASFPVNAINYCLTFCNVSLAAIDYIVFYEKPFLKFERLVETFFAFAPFGIRFYLKAAPVWVKERLFVKKKIIKTLKTIEKSWDYDGKNLLFTNHHQSHAASAFFPSPYNDAVVLTMDGVGEWTTTSVSLGSGNKVQKVQEINFPHSIGLLYSAFTYFLGFKVNCDEYKVMGLAPYGFPRYVEIILGNLIDVKEDGSFKLNMDYFNYTVGLVMTNNRFHQLFGHHPRKPSDEINLFHMDIASSIQKVTEKIVIRIVNNLHKKYQLPNLCLAGGVALNCVINGKLLTESPFKNIWVQPAAGDAGGAVGAAYFTYFQFLGHKRSIDNSKIDRMKGAYLGPSFTEEEIKVALKDRKVKYHELNTDLFFTKLAQLIAEGKVIGWFNGRMEFGPRALGNRSIIGDPRSPIMQSIINKKIKFRESFRPFAPAIMQEHTKEFFDLNIESPYMLFTAGVAKKQRIDGNDNSLKGFDKLKQIRSTIPATTHIDNSARVQTVNHTNKDFYRLINEFYKLTGCPLVINTSFNVMNEPIVCTPNEAIQCFFDTDLDILAFKNIIVYKTENQ